MAALSSCSVLKSTCDAATISSCDPKISTMGSPKSVVFIRGANGPLRKIRAEQARPRDQEAKPTLSRRGVMFTSLSTLGITLLPRSSSADEDNDKDFREKILEAIENLQQLLSKSLGDAKEAVTTKAEEAITSLKFGDDKAAETLIEVKSSIDETVQEDKLTQN